MSFWGQESCTWTVLCTTCARCTRRSTSRSVGFYVFGCVLSRFLSAQQLEVSSNGANHWTSVYLSTSQQNILNMCNQHQIHNRWHPTAEIGTVCLGLKHTFEDLGELALHRQSETQWTVMKWSMNSSQDLISYVFCWVLRKQYILKLIHTCIITISIELHTDMYSFFHVFPCGPFGAPQGRCASPIENRWSK